MNKKGYLSFVLHAHLPFVHHPEDDSLLEESWLFEAISETYIPLLKMFKKLEEENVKYMITMTMTPPLLSMLDNELLKKRYIIYLKDRIELSLKEIERTKDNVKINKLSRYYYERYKEDLNFYLNTLKSDIISGFKYFQDKGFLEIITCGATHGYFPILILNEKAVKAQIQVGVETYEKYFGRKPNGIWLPECGYVPESDKYLKEFGIKYIITETHGILYANPRPVFGTFSPIVSPTGIVAFGRDLESSRQVWSSIIGYPGDYNYRDFYKDIGYDIEDYEYIKPYIAKNGVRVHTGIKYHKITGKTFEKDIYDLDDAMQSAENQASHFIHSRIKQLKQAENMPIPPVILCPYDAELYGHWWYEGPYWLYILFKKIHFDQNTIELITPSEYLKINSEIQESAPCISSWGANGYSEVWINESNDYAHKHLLTLANRMTYIANKFKNETDPLKIRVLNQLARELLLLQSSDWLFIITNGTMVEYAHRRINLHTGRFNALYKMLEQNEIATNYLKDLEIKDNIFKDIDFRIYSD